MKKYIDQLNSLIKELEESKEKAEQIKNDNRNLNFERSREISIKDDKEKKLDFYNNAKDTISSYKGIGTIGLIITLLMIIATIIAFITNLGIGFGSAILTLASSGVPILYYSLAIAEKYELYELGLNNLEAVHKLETEINDSTEVISKLTTKIEKNEKLLKDITTNSISLNEKIIGLKAIIYYLDTENTNTKSNKEKIEKPKTRIKRKETDK